MLEMNFLKKNKIKFPLIYVSTVMYFYANNMLHFIAEVKNVKTQEQIS